MTYILIERSTILAIAALAFAAGALSAQTTTNINVTDSRPLAGAIDALENSDGITINYEDPPYQNMSDVVDVANDELRATRPGFQLLVPRIGTVNAEVPSREQSSVSMADGLADVNTLLAAYRLNNLPGDFRAEQANNMIYVVPTRTLEAGGSTMSVNSPMATFITIPTAQRTIEDTLQAILDAASQASGMKIVIGAFPFFSYSSVNFGASNEAARDALARLFGQVGWKQSYRLLFDPKPDKARSIDYMFNLRPTGFKPPLAPVGAGSVLKPVDAAPHSPPTSSEPPFFRRAK